MLATFDTHELVKELKVAGFTENQAEAVTRVVKSAHDLGFSDLATKADLATLEMDMTGIKTDVAGLKTEVVGIKATVAVLSAKLDNFATNYATKAELSDMRNDIIRWVFGIAFGQAASIIALLKLLPGAHP